MIVNEFRYMGDFRCVVHALQGRVLPDIGITCGFHTSSRIASPVAFVSDDVPRHQRTADCVVFTTNGPTRQTSSTTRAVPKSP